MTVTNQNYIQKEIKHRLNSGNTCYHSVQGILFSRSLYKDLQISTLLSFHPLFLLVVKLGATFGEIMLRVLKKRLLIIFASKRKGLT